MAGEGSGTIRGEAIHVEVIRAWPRHHESRGLTLPAGATVAQHPEVVARAREIMAREHTPCAVPAWNF